MFEKAYITNRHIGKIVLDITTSEEHSSSINITENPIESGALVADHMALQPRELNITGMVSNYEPPKHTGTQLGDFFNIRGGLDFLDKVDIFNHWQARAEQVINKAQRVATNVLNLSKSARPLAPWLPNFEMGGMNDETEQLNKVNKIYNDLIALQKSGEAFEIQTGLNLYKNMLLQNINVTQKQDGAAVFTLKLREIFIVQTTTTARTSTGKKGSSAGGRKRSARAAIQNAPPSQKGRTQPTANPSEKKTSALFDMFN